VVEKIKCANTNWTSYCNQDEEHDPSEDFEEYLACGVCGDNGKKPTALFGITIAGS
jgi:histone acetyltransferase SAS3